MYKFAERAARGHCHMHGFFCLLGSYGTKCPTCETLNNK